MDISYSSILFFFFYVLDYLTGWEFSKTIQLQLSSFSFPFTDYPPTPPGSAFIKPQPPTAESWGPAFWLWFSRQFGLAENYLQPPTLQCRTSPYPTPQGFEEWLHLCYYALTEHPCSVLACLPSLMTTDFMAFKNRVEVVKKEGRRKKLFSLT